MKGIFILVLSIFMFTGCINEDENSEQLRSLIFEPEYGIEPPYWVNIEQDSNIVQIEWSRVINASYYHVYMAKNVADNFVKINNDFIENYSYINDLQNGSIYFFYVTAVNEFGKESSRSEIVSIQMQSGL